MKATKKRNYLSEQTPANNGTDRVSGENLNSSPPAFGQQSIQLCPTVGEFARTSSVPAAFPPEKLPPQSTGYLRSESGLPIYYSRWSPSVSNRGVVLILHGLGEHGGRYRHLVSSLQQSGYTVYAHDHQGFGRSGGARCYVQGFHDYLSDITQVVSMARLRNPGLPCCLYGHSMGGLLGLLHLMEAPGAIDLAIIASPSLQSHNLSPVNRILKAMLILLHKIQPTLTFQQRGSLDVISRDWEEVQIALQDSLGVPKRSARWVVEFFETMQEVRGRAGEIRLPILMLQGLADAVVMPAATQEFFSNVSSVDKSLRLYEGYYHELHNDLGRERPISAVLDWLNSRCLETDSSL